MSSIASCQITALYLFDVADAIDLGKLPGLLQAATVPARLAPKPATPSYVQYQQPPLLLDGGTIDAPDGATYRVRVKFFDYGVISLALGRPFSGDWDELLGIGQELIDNDALETRAEQSCRALVQRLGAAMTTPRTSFLSEDYLVISVTALDQPVSGEELVARYGPRIATMLRGERQPLSRQETEDVLRHRVSYLADDLVVPTWNAAFVYDTDAGAQAALEILEFANSQLLEFRYYDDLLDKELGRIYRELQKLRWYDTLVGGHYTRAAHQLHSLFIDVNEITDKSENALKMVGDVYAARLFSLAAKRLGLLRWKGNVQEKLKTLDDIYRFTVEQTAISRGHFLELTIVLILIFELILFFLGIMT
jgi:hypothetical protein